MTNPTRRSTLRGISLATIAAGLAVPALASTKPDDGADAELIQLCGEIIALKPKRDAVFAVRHTIEDEHRTEAELDALFARQEAATLSGSL
jgi:hypothetical protein